MWERVKGAASGGEVSVSILTSSKSLLEQKDLKSENTFEGGVFGLRIKFRRRSQPVGGGGGG